eukprot:TRINITY_DN2109_c0_g2_i1.p1 TRINITY_DN2109_c0_g2~~TRINITY_DN2109_c0_g2_i1.p1  ORF type:complete len:284 (-),score=45.39 TRINITY_DN2109_c0_g2_i1:74-799(-)
MYPLSVACYATDDDMGIVQMLLDHGANIKNKCGPHVYATHEAAAAGNLKCLKLLLENGGEELLQEVAQDDNNILHLACGSIKRDCPNLVKFLLDKGVPWDKKNARENTPFLCAAQHRNIKVCELLLKEKGADILKVKGWWNRNALHCAVYCRKDSPELVSMLIKAGIDLKEKTMGDSESLAIHAAAERGYLESVKLLEAAWPESIHEKDSLGRTPLDRAKSSKYANRKPYKDVIDYLSSKL